MDRLAFESVYTIARKVAHRKALSALGRCGIVPDELEDVESELLLDFYQRLAMFDGRRASLGTFAWRVMDRKLLRILRHRLAQRRVVSILTEPLPEDHPQNPLQKCRGVAHLPSPAPQWELRLDVERVIVTLPTPLAEVAQALCWMSPTEASRFLGCTRTTVYGRIAKLRAALLAAGIGLGQRQGRKLPRNCAEVSGIVPAEAINLAPPTDQASRRTSIYGNSIDGHPHGRSTTRPSGTTERIRLPVTSPLAEQWLERNLKEAAC
ncbi:MAG: sigma-70 family RNA polymerase sigma factor [Acidobacteria bacterium]|nr:sigma-70 family RNA polymerase sigma factor [Acidobacteriota bacterium]